MSSLQLKNNAPRRSGRRCSRLIRSPFSLALLAFLGLTNVWVSKVLAAPGDLDPTFGNGGRVTTDFGAGELARAAAIQADGKIVVAGQSADLYGNGQFALARYNPDGSLDMSFDGDGKITTRLDYGSEAFDVAIQTVMEAGQPAEKIVAVGASQSALGTFFALARYNPDGSLDNTFGGDGKVTTAFTGGGYALGVAIQSDGKIVASGIAFTPVIAGITHGDFALARYNLDGSLDPTFDGDGKVVTNIGAYVTNYYYGRVPGFSSDAAKDVAIQSDGKIVAAGYAFLECSPSPPTGRCQDFALARYLPNGQLDADFGLGGTVTTDFGVPLDNLRSSEYIEGIAVQPDGNIVAAGLSFTTNNFVLARYTSTGILDITFGTGGKVTTSFGGGSSSQRNGAPDVVIQTDGRIVAAGSAAIWLSETLARYNTNGSLDTSFGMNGKVINQVFYVRGLALQNDGKLVIVGGNGAGDFALARYLS